jgi:UDP-4-amino-4,6-dideoxy-N-acetyl-beta-L-altrosamine N-acetyltransferase
MAARTETIKSTHSLTELLKPSVTLEPVKQNIETRHNWLAWLNDPDISKWMYSDKPYSMQEVFRWIDRVVADPKRHYFSIVTEGKPVGFVSLRQDHSPQTSAEIGIVIGAKEKQSQGIGTETIRQVLEYAEHELHLTSIRANIKPENEKSLRLFTAFGFVHTNDLSINGVPFMKLEKTLIQTKNQ